MRNKKQKNYQQQGKIDEEKVKWNGALSAFKHNKSSFTYFEG